MFIGRGKYRLSLSLSLSLSEAPAGTSCAAAVAPGWQGAKWGPRVIRRLPGRRRIPILLFAVLDRPVKHFDTLMRYPEVRHGRGVIPPPCSPWRRKLLSPGLHCSVRAPPPPPPPPPCIPAWLQDCS